MFRKYEGQLKMIISWKKFRFAIKRRSKNKNLDYLIDLTFRNINRLFVLSLRNGDNDPTKNYYNKLLLLLQYWITCH